MGRQIDDYKSEFPEGSILCKQNDAASDLFMLNKGQIRVLLGDEEVACIDEPGTIFGEMSLFLNEPRSATLIAGKKSLVTVIGRENLNGIAERMPDFFLRITTTLWSRFKNNVEMIHEMETIKPDSAKNDLRSLRNALVVLMKSERIFWLKKYIDELQ